jgi:hypothetical protein
MFDFGQSGYFAAANARLAGIGVKTMAILGGRRYRWLVIIWVLIGIIVAWEHTYITVALLKLVASALLAIFLWPLILLGVNLHLH